MIGLADNSGVSTGLNTCDEYGVPGAGNIGLLQYTGQMWLPQAQLHHYRARAYAPQLGRFMQTDPIGYAAGTNLYAYVGGDPVNWVDPLGLERQFRDADACRRAGGIPTERINPENGLKICEFPTTLPPIGTDYPIIGGGLGAGSRDPNRICSSSSAFGVAGFAGEAMASGSAALAELASGKNLPSSVRILGVPGATMSLTSEVLLMTAERQAGESWSSVSSALFGRLATDAAFAVGGGTLVARNSPPQLRVPAFALGALGALTISETSDLRIKGGELARRLATGRNSRVCQ